MLPVYLIFAVLAHTGHDRGQVLGEVGGDVPARTGFGLA